MIRRQFYMRSRSIWVSPCA